MGGSPNLLMPVKPAYTASWASHTRRSPKSSEPGTDMFVPIGTPVFAPADGRIYGSGNTIGPATGRWVGIDLDNGLRFRCMHLSRLERSSGAVKRGDLIGYSGASGYGYEDFRRAPGMPDAHTHVTLWPTHASRFGYDRNGNPYTVDFMQYVGGSQSAGGDSTSWEDIMAKLDDDDRKWLDRQFELVRDLLQVPGQPYGWPQANSNAIAAITPLIGDVQNRVRGSDPRGDMLQLIREDLGKPIKADVDEAALAREIAPLLPGQMGALSDADVARIAKAAADEQARRLAT